MDPQTAFQSYLSGALETFGIDADETERAVMAGVWQVYREGMEMLAEADLSGVEPEQAPDPSRPPAR
ncbi:MAG: hypothetical protein ACRDL6_02530 [Solirubrobacterales bacterium]